MEIKTTRYFRTRTVNQHPEAYIYFTYLFTALTHPLVCETQLDGRTRRWVYVPEEDKYLRVIVEPDGETVHNAMFDRGFRRRRERP